MGFVHPVFFDHFLSLFPWGRTNQSSGRFPLVDSHNFTISLSKTNHNLRILREFFNFFEIEELRFEAWIPSHFRLKLEPRLYIRLRMTRIHTNKNNTMHWIQSG